MPSKVHVTLELNYAPAVGWNFFILLQNSEKGNKSPPTNDPLTTKIDTSTSSLLPHSYFSNFLIRKICGYYFFSPNIFLGCDARRRVYWVFDALI